MSRLDGLLEQHVQEQVHWFGFDHQSLAGSVSLALVLVDTVIVNNRDIARAPVITNIVVDLVPLAVKDVERGLVDVPVLLRFSAGAVLFQVQVKRLSDPVLGFDVVA